MNYVSYDEFKKMDMRLGIIRFVEPVEGTDKLLRFEIDFGRSFAATVPVSNGDPLVSNKSLDQVISCTGSCKKEKDCDTCDEECKCEILCTCEPLSVETPFDKEEYQGRDVRQIVSGVREYFPEYEQLVGKHGLYILNLEPREIRGVMSYGMLMAVDGKNGDPVFLEARGDIEPGAKIR